MYLIVCDLKKCFILVFMHILSILQFSILLFSSHDFPNKITNLSLIMSMSPCLCPMSQLSLHSCCVKLQFFCRRRKGMNGCFTSSDFLSECLNAPYHLCDGCEYKKNTVTSRTNFCCFCCWMDDCFLFFSFSLLFCLLSLSSNFIRRLERKKLTE